MHINVSKYANTIAISLLEYTFILMTRSYNQCNESEATALSLDSLDHCRHVARQLFIYYLERTDGHGSV